MYCMRRRVGGFCLFGGLFVLFGVFLGLVWFGVWFWFVVFCLVGCCLLWVFLFVCWVLGFVRLFWGFLWLVWVFCLVVLPCFFFFFARILLKWVGETSLEMYKQALPAHTITSAAWKHMCPGPYSPGVKLPKSGCLTHRELPGKVWEKCILESDLNWAKTEKLQIPWKSEGAVAALNTAQLLSVFN